MMARSAYPLDKNLQDLLSVKEITREDVLELKHILRGGSIVDWPRMHFRSLPAVNEFLRCSQYDPDNRLDLERLQVIHRSAIEYVQTVLGIDIPNVLAHPHRIQNLFLYASSEGPYRGRACTILKVMHVINHLEARQLLYNLPVSERGLFARVDKRVSAAVEWMQNLGFPIESYQASQKTKDSLITKLLSKRKDTAAQVFDRIRFRIIAVNRRDVLPILLHMKKHLFPYPYVIPGESTNTIANLPTLFKESFGIDLDEDDELMMQAVPNPFSHREFRVISLVVDTPVRVDDLTDPASRRLLTKFGHIVFIPTEFQIFDKASYFLNESGPAAHAQYKARQIREVISRLYRGNGVVVSQDTNWKPRGATETTAEIVEGALPEKDEGQ